MRLSVARVFMGESFSSSTFCKSGSVDKYCLNLLLSWDILFSPSMVTESFARYSSLSRYPWTFRV